MRLLFKQRFFSWFDSYDVYNEAGNTVFSVEGRLSWGKRLEIHDASGAYLGMLKQKVFSLEAHLHFLWKIVLNWALQLAVAL